MDALPASGLRRRGRPVLLQDVRSMHRNAAHQLRQNGRPGGGQKDAGATRNACHFDGANPPIVAARAAGR